MKDSVARRMSYTSPMPDEPIEEQLRRFFAQDGRDVVAAYLFGSVARGTHGPGSDVDIAVLLERPPPRTFEGLPLDLEARLEKVLGRPVQLVVLNDAPPDLVHRVLRDGRLLLGPGSVAPHRLRGQGPQRVLRPAAAPDPLPPAAMTDPDLISKKLALVETCVAELRALGRPQDIERDVREERFVEHTLQIAIQAAVDVASHIVSDERLGEPRTNRELFEILARGGWLPEDLAATCGRMVGLRNILVHGYETVDLSVIRDVVQHRLDDLLAFVSAIRARLER